ncbi:unnamed protein product [Dracunculus medinensis]|uniref:Ras-associating domain-containing protein n=1 Tax=Dracunculus medinensis TaxID=318479 RepID=A0A0N4UHY5_DRAME|nr:unnamed protein product [Dracunculus medinensis]
MNAQRCCGVFVPWSDMDSSRFIRAYVILWIHIVLSEALARIAQKTITPLKTKKYKCIEIENDEDNKDNKMDRNDENQDKLWQSLDTKDIFKEESPFHQTVPFNKALPERTTIQVQYLAKLYGVKDVESWVYKHCDLARLYLPNASCHDIHALIKSCNIPKQ